MTASLIKMVVKYLHRFVLILYFKDKGMHPMLLKPD